MTAQLTCPICNADSGRPSVLVAENAIVNSCPACGGIWIAAKVFEQLVKQASDGSPDAAAAIAKGKSGAKRKQPKLAKPVLEASEVSEAARAYLPCPICGELMGRQNFAHRSGIKVHACRQHGVWFDDERQLESLVKWVQSGALATARKELTDQENRDEKARRQLTRELNESSRSNWYF